MLLEENKPLAPFTTLGIGGPARWFVSAASEEEVAEAASWAHEHGVPLFVLGGGSNLLVSDTGFPGLVLLVALRGISAAAPADDHGQVAERGVYRVAAGEEWDAFVERAAGENCAGIECLAGIPARSVAHLCKMSAHTGKKWLRPSSGCGRSIFRIGDLPNLPRRSANLLTAAAVSTRRSEAATW